MAYKPLKESSILFFSLYILQLSFQSLPGVTSMAISAEIYPSMVRGTGAGISAALGKVGATLGILVGSVLFLFQPHERMENRDKDFWTFIFACGAALESQAPITSQS